MTEVKCGEILQRLLDREDIQDITITFKDTNSVSVKQAMDVWKLFCEDVTIGTPAKRPKRPDKRKIKDTGKLLALKKAGWKAEKIADEFGVSVQTIYTYLRKLKKDDEPF